MQGPMSVSVLSTNPEQKLLVEKLITARVEEYYVKTSSFDMLQPSLVNLNGTLNSEQILNVELGLTEVTQDLYKSLMGRNPSHFQDGPQYPVEQVTWYDCLIFCNELSKFLNFKPCYTITDIEMDASGDHVEKANVVWDQNADGFRLPTVAEWIMFAKAGTNNIWPGCNHHRALRRYAWIYENAQYKTKPVGQKAPNEWGLYDMSGNVDEWCWDEQTIDPEYPLDPGDEACKITKGGGIGTYGELTAIDHKHFYLPSAVSSELGFRLARTIK